MKNKILVLLTFIIFLQYGCKKEYKENEELNTENNFSGLPYQMTSNHHNYIIFGDVNHFAGCFSHSKSCMGQIIKADNSGTVQCGNISLNGSLLPINTVALNKEFKNQNWFNQNNTIVLGGLSSEDFNPLTTQMNFVKPLVFSKPTPNRQPNNYFLNQPVDLEWETGDPDDDMLLEIRSKVLPTAEQAQQGVLGYYTTFIKDNGMYTIPASLINKFNTIKGLHITVYRFNNEEVVTGKRTIDFVTYSSFAGTFMFKPSN